jgi:uncharacterized membrane-anchored protein
MSFRCIIVFLALGLSWSTGSWAFDEDRMIEKIQQLNWKQKPGQHELTAINAVYSLDESEWLLTGAQAGKFLELTQGDSGWGEVDLLTMTMSGPMNGAFVIYTHQPIGYVEDEDWSSLDSDSILETLRQGQAESNERRAAAGYPTLEVVGWADRPTYNEGADAAYWAVELRDSSGETTINATALKLSRDGFTNITWVGSAEQFSSANEVLLASSDAYQFVDGARYADFRSGDALAGIGLAALATGIVTGKGWSKAAGAGLIAVLVALAKKFWFLLILPFLWLGRLFRKPSAEPAAPED